MRSSESLSTSTTIQAACHIPATPKRETAYISPEPSIPNSRKTQTINKPTPLKSSPTAHAPHPPPPSTPPPHSQTPTLPDPRHARSLAEAITSISFSHPCINSPSSKNIHIPNPPHTTHSCPSYGPLLPSARPQQTAPPRSPSPSRRSKSRDFVCRCCSVRGAFGVVVRWGCGVGGVDFRYGELVNERKYLIW